MPIVERCEVCNFRLPRVQREDTRYCGSTCRVRASRARRKGRSPADLRRRFAWSRTPTASRSWVLLWYRRLAHGPLRVLAEQRKETHALRTELAEARATIQRQAAELATLKEQLATLAAQSDRETAATHELRTERDIAEEKARTTAAELTEARALAQQRGAEIDETNLALRVAQQRSTALGNELAAVREQSAEQSNRVGTLEMQLALVKQEKAHRDVQLAALAKRLGDTQRITDRTLDEVRTARAERDSAQIQAVLLEAAIEKAHWLVGIKSSEAEENRDARNVAERRVAHLRHKLSQARATSAQRRRRVEVLGVRLAKTKQEAAERQFEHEKKLKQANDCLA